MMYFNTVEQCLTTLYGPYNAYNFIKSSIANSFELYKEEKEKRLIVLYVDITFFSHINTKPNLKEQFSKCLFMETKDIKLLYDQKNNIMYMGFSNKFIGNPINALAYHLFYTNTLPVFLSGSNYTKEITDLLVDMYCFINNIDKEKFKDELKKKQQEAIEKSLIDLCMKTYSNVKRATSADLELTKKRLNEIRQEIVTLTARTFALEDQLAGMNEEKYVNEFKKQIEDVRNHKKVHNVEVVENGKIRIYTKMLYMYEPKTKKYYQLGEMKIEIDFVTNNISFFNLTSTRDGFWNRCQHPHVNSSGHPCLGNFNGVIVELIANRNLYPLLIASLKYLESVNTDDVAGGYIYKWDEVEPKDMISYDGQYVSAAEKSDENNDLGTCYVCGESITANDEAITCRSCGRTVHRSCAEVDNSGDVLCDSCRENYTRCEVCGNFVHWDDVYSCPTCDRNYCDDCWDDESREGGEYCSHCNDSEEW